MRVQPYLFFQGRCEEALDFYRQTIGAEVTMMMRFEESPDAPPPGVVPPGWERKIMHAGVRIGDTEIMVSDGCDGEAAFAGFSLALTVDDIAETDRVFAALAEGGEVTMPLGETFWAPRFGMLTDRFGVGWMIGVDGEDTPSEAHPR